MPPNCKFKAVLFDLGGTLIKTVNVPEIYRKILQAHGVKASAEDIAKAHEQNEIEFDIEERIEYTRDFWIKWNAKVLERIGIEENRQFLAEKIDALWWDYAELETYADVSETLAQLENRQIKTGIITNAFEKDYNQIFQKLDWADRFDVLVGIDACNKAKPAPEIFHCAIEELHVKPEEAIFVGDSVKRDYEGARKAGLKPLLINRTGEKLVDVETIANLNEVLHFI